MANTVPYEVIAAPYTIYYAPVGTAFPLVSSAPLSPWKLVGTSGNLNYDDGVGVVISSKQSMAKFKALGDAGTRKVFRTDESLMVKVRIADLTVEQVKLAFNSNTMTTVSASTGIPGTKKIGLSRGFTVATMALLIRGDVSPYGDSPLAMQWEIPIACQVGEPELVLKKDQAIGLDLEWEVLVDASASSTDERFGRFIAQTAAPL